MVALNMQIEFERLLYTSNPEFTTSEKLDTDEIFSYLNIAQLRTTKAKYFPTSNILENVKIIQGNVDELRNMIKRSTLTLGAAIDTLHGYLVALPNDYLHYIRSDSSITRSALPVIGGASIVPNRIVDYMDIDQLVTSAFSKPIIRKPAIVFEEDDAMVIFRDAYTTLGNVYLTYLRMPADISLTQDCELPEYLHEEIVALAVDIFRREKYLLASKGSKDDDRGNA